ncbi:hypothetical protein [Pontibacter anaerobius]|uniref:Uncharacterized protein n=1 Tax=Pontibacter anaerobius TaxID=2993940 RepID=A0ABT3RDZ1_9BACT|nr:hypothetical protein [Pontibacter anaerobius]MCX2740078.1 hypothetical protein [Pontibacter anaerobius]
MNTEVIEGTAGEWGTAPGSGGNGGDVTLRYSTSGFTPNFNRKDAPHSITVLYQAGLAGKRGRDGVSYEGSLSRQSMSYQPSHNELRDGTVQLEKK